MSKNRSLYRRKYDVEVNSCSYLRNVAQAALIRFLISVVSCCWNVTICPRCFGAFHLDNICTLLLSITIPSHLLELWFRSSQMYLKSHLFFDLDEFTHHFSSCSIKVANKNTSSANRKFERQSNSKCLQKICPFLFSLAIVEIRLSRPPAVQC